MLECCGGMWKQNWAPQVNCAIAEDPGIYLAEEICKLLEQQVSESSDIYIYDSEQTLVILPMEHLDFPDQQG